MGMQAKLTALAVNLNIPRGYYSKVVTPCLVVRPAWAQSNG